MANSCDDGEFERVRLQDDDDEEFDSTRLVEMLSSKLPEELEKERHCRNGVSRFLNLLEGDEKDQKTSDVDRLITPERKTLNLRRKGSSEANQQMFLHEDNFKKSSESSRSEPRFVDPKEGSNGPKSPASECRNLAPKTKTMKGNIVPVQLPNPPPDLPEKFKDIIRSMGCEEEAVLVIQKTVYNSDVNKNQGRFAMPVKQVINEGFLTDEEQARFTVENKDEMIQVVFIDPYHSVCSLNLKKWYMSKPGGQCSSSWVLISPWNEVVKKNGLEEGMIVQVWSFRKGSQIGFAMVKLEK